MPVVFRRLRSHVAGDFESPAGGAVETIHPSLTGIGDPAFQLRAKRSPTSFSDTFHSRSAFSGSSAYDLTPSRASGASLTAAMWQSSRYNPPRPASSGAVA